VPRDVRQPRAPLRRWRNPLLRGADLHLNGAILTRPDFASQGPRWTGRQNEESARGGARPPPLESARPIRRIGSPQWRCWKSETARQAGA
jgi:hypothetical protein